MSFCVVSWNFGSRFYKCMLSTSDENVRQKEVFVASRLLRKKRICRILDFERKKKDVFSTLSLMPFQMMCKQLINQFIAKLDRPLFTGVFIHAIYFC